MLATPLWCILNFLALAVVVRGRVAPLSRDCTVRAWARAPDLVPNTIVRGDARIKIGAECPAIDNVSFGLRFKERSFVKALYSREDAKQLHSRHADFDFLSPWPSPNAELLTNKNLWIIREEERTVFETTQPLSIGIGSDVAPHDTVQTFAILIPSTNFPQMLQRASFRGPPEREILEVEWIYEYFVQITFSNGTTKDIPAGHTAFQPIHDPDSVIQGPSSTTIGLGPRNGKHVENMHTANYSMEIVGDSGLTFFAGATGQFVSAVVTRTGLARRFSTSLNIVACVVPELSSRWRNQYDVSNYAHPVTDSFVLRDKKAASGVWGQRCPRNPIAVTMPDSSSDEIKANEIVTTSARLTIPIALQDTHIVDFETYYQSLTNALTITLRVPRVEDEDVDPDDPNGEHDAYHGPRMFESDEEAWVPWERPRFMKNRIYSGRAPVTVHPATEITAPQHCLPGGAAVLGQVILSDNTNCERLSFTHYLDEGARGPIFVDYDAVDALLAEDPAERASRAPILKPVVSSPPEGEERVYRYYVDNPNSPSIYVGETWAKKVANKD